MLKTRDPALPYSDKRSLKWLENISSRNKELGKPGKGIALGGVTAFKISPVQRQVIDLQFTNCINVQETGLPCVLAIFVLFKVGEGVSWTPGGSCRLQEKDADCEVLLNMVWDSVWKVTLAYLHVVLYFHSGTGFQPFFSFLELTLLLISLTSTKTGSLSLPSCGREACWGIVTQGQPQPHSFGCWVKSVSAHVLELHSCHCKLLSYESMCSRVFW